MVIETIQPFFSFTLPKDMVSKGEKLQDSCFNVSFRATLTAAGLAAKSGPALERCHFLGKERKRLLNLLNFLPDRQCLTFSKGKCFKEDFAESFFKQSQLNGKLEGWDKRVQHEAREASGEGRRLTSCDFVRNM